MADGKPRPTESQDSKQTAKGSRDVWGYVGLGTQLAASVVLFVALGWWVDQHFGWTPWAMLGLGTLGVVVGLYHFVKEALK